MSCCCAKFWYAITLKNVTDNTQKGVVTMNRKIALCSILIMMFSNSWCMKNVGEEIVKELSSITILDLLKKEAYYNLSSEEQKIWEQQVFNRKYKPPFDEVSNVHHKVTVNMIYNPLTRSIIPSYDFNPTYYSRLYYAVLDKVAHIPPTTLRRIVRAGK